VIRWILPSTWAAEVAHAQDSTRLTHALCGRYLIVYGAAGDAPPRCTDCLAALAEEDHGA
jgi:hypothetical protein